MRPELFYDNWRKENGITVEGYQLNRKQILQMLVDYSNTFKYAKSNLEETIFKKFFTDVGIGPMRKDFEYAIKWAIREAVQQTKTDWIKFEDGKPSIGQEIWIVWPSGNYRPELRLWDENMQKQIWDDMRWLPVPNYKP